MGIFSLLMGVYAIVTRFKLAKWHSGAPTHIIIYSILSAVFGVVFGSLEGTLTLSTVIGSIAHVVINSVYYTKRRHLFVC